MKQSAIILQTNFSTIKQNYVNEIQYNKSIILMIVELTNQIKRKKTTTEAPAEGRYLLYNSLGLP